MSTSNQETIRIRWVRSGIAFNRKQKEIVRSLGLRRLHQVVERQDSPSVRGLVAKVAHLVEIVNGEGGRSRSSVSEYTIRQAVPSEVAPAESSPAAEPEEAASAEVPSGSNL